MGQTIFYNKSLFINCNPEKSRHSRGNGNPVFSKFLDTRLREYDGLTDFIDKH
jgi:hypothetical protein